MNTLTLAVALKRATNYLRRTVEENEFQRWCAQGLESDGLHVDKTDLDRFLLGMAERERLMTVSETAERVLKCWGVRVDNRTIRVWCDKGYPTKKGRAHLRYVVSPVFSATRRLVHPADLKLFVGTVGVANLGRVGRPLVRGKQKE